MSDPISQPSPDGVRAGPVHAVPITTDQAVEWLRANGHPTMTRAALDQALRRARRARATGRMGPDLFPEPTVIWGRNTWTASQLALWVPLGRGARTDRHAR